MSTPAAVDHHYSSTGLPTWKIGFWTFIASECLFFGTLISTYMVYKHSSVQGPLPHEILNIPLTSISTFVLLMSSLAMVLALDGVTRGRRALAMVWLAAVIVLGCVFLGFQAYEYMHAYSELNLKLSSGAYGSTFFMLTGFHGFHVFIGMLMLLFITIRIMRGHFTPERHFGFEGAAWYWHFVDVVWLGLYIVVYWL